MSWALHVEKTPPSEAEAEASRWQRHAIYRVPEFIKDVNPKAYRPQVVSLGPFHHGDATLLPMEAHKRRALAHLLSRSGRPLEDFVAAVKEIAEPLESAYQDLGAEWRSGGRERFLEVMLVDGCFLLEVMKAVEEDGSDYAPNDPIFSHHGVLYMVPYIRRDMLMLENQLPLILLEKLVAVETAKPTLDVPNSSPELDILYEVLGGEASMSQNGDVINRMVLRFLTPMPRVATSGVGIGLHALDVYRRNMLYGHYQHRSPRQMPEMDIMIRSAVELYEAGIRFRKSSSESLHDIGFRHGVLSMPAVTVDDSTEYMFFNMMAFERLHAGAGSAVAAYVFFMSSVVLGSARDVALLRSEGIVQNAAGSDKAVAQMFERMSREAVFGPESAAAVGAVLQQVNAYCRRRTWRMCGAGTRRSRRWEEWLRATTWATLAVVLLVVLIVQTVYIALQFYMLRRR